MSNIIWSITILAGGMYGALCLYLFLMQAKLLYYPNIPSRELTGNPADINLDYETVTLRTSDNGAILLNQEKFLRRRSLFSAGHWEQR
ncbi:MAG: hypothetical protein P8Y04_08490 [Desulfobulbaceae bacterium]